MKVIISKDSGFCYGVKRAVRLVTSEQAKNIPCVCYGNLINNKQVIERLGLTVVDHIQERESLEHANFVVRSHGVPMDVYQKVKDMGIRIIDATCPFVSRIHRLVQEAHQAGRRVFIFGDPTHPEVIGTNGWCNNQATMIQKASDIPVYNDDCCVVLQTTFNLATWSQLLPIVYERLPNATIHHTICEATERRQMAALETAQKVEYMVVVGDEQSSNTRKLYELCSERVPTVHIETHNELNSTIFEGIEIVGVTAGASTPDWIIDDVIKKINQFKKREERLMNEQNPMAEVMDQIQESVRLPRRGSVIKGRIIQVDPEQIFVNIGYKNDGVIPKAEVSADPSFDLVENFNDGDEVDVCIVNQDNGEGSVLLSIKRVRVDKEWQELEELFQEKQQITVKVTEVVKGGVIAYYNEIKGFIPASQVTDRYVKNLKPFIGKELLVDILDVSKQKKRAVFSHKEIAIKDKQEKSDKFWEGIQVGTVIKGEVKRLTHFGAFVDIGGLDGLVHITEISWGRIRPANESLKVGEIIDVKIIDADRDANKVSLSIKQLIPEPWSDFAERYFVDYIYYGTVVNLTEFGAFIELEPGVEGLVHISQIAKDHIEKPADVLKVGQQVEVKIIDYSLEDKRVKLSIKAVEEEDALSDEVEQTEEQEEAVETEE